MAHLKYYHDEEVEFKEAFDKKMSSEITMIIYKKLCRHFKLREARVKWTSGRNHPRCCSWQITFNYNFNNIGVLCHEVAHLYQFQKPRKSKIWHSKEHWKIMKRMINYCAKKNYFEEEVVRRLSPKPVKPQPTKLEIKSQELNKLQEKIVRYEKKIKMYQKKLSKAKRGFSLRSKHLQTLNCEVMS